MNAFKYFKLYKLTELSKGVMPKMFLFIFSQIAVFNLFLNNIGQVDLLMVLIIAPVGAVFMYSHSNQLNKSGVIMTYPITSKRRYYYDLLASLYYMLITLLVFIAYVVILLILNILFNWGMLELGSIETANFGYLYGIGYALIYILMIIFTIQPLKYIKDTKTWYISYGLVISYLFGFNVLTASLLKNGLTVRYNITNLFHTGSNPLVIMGLVLFIGIATIAVSIKISLELAKNK